MTPPENRPRAARHDARRLEVLILPAVLLALIALRGGA